MNRLIPRLRTLFLFGLLWFSATSAGLRFDHNGLAFARTAPVEDTDSDALLDGDFTDDSVLDDSTPKDDSENGPSNNDDELDQITKEDLPTRPERPKFKPTSPTRPKAVTKRLDVKSISIEEVEDYDPNRHWLTGQFAFLRNMGTDGTYGYYAGAGARYGYSLFKDLFFYSKDAQDSLTAEVGVFGVKLSNIQNEGDSYTVIPIIFTGRYNIALNENWILFFYAGMVNNIVLNSANADGDFLSAIQSPPPAVGVGFFILVGPYWYARMDVGLDQLGLGLVLRF